MLCTAFQKCCIENVPSLNANSHYTIFIPKTVVLKRCIALTNVRFRNIGFQFHTPSKKEKISSEKKHFLVKNHVFNQKSQFSGIFKRSILDFDSQSVLGVKCNSQWGPRIKKTWYLSVTISISGYFDEFLILRKVQGENANKSTTFIKRWLCNISATEFWIFHHQGALETKIKY